MSYIYPNFKTKKAAIDAIKRGERITCKSNTPWGQAEITNGTESIEGPHFPEAHKWYGIATIQAGRVVKLT